MPISKEHEVVATRKPRETDLSSARLKERWSQRLKDESVFSARTTERRYAERIKRTLGDIVAGRLTAISAETRLRRDLAALGYSPRTGFAGSDAKVPPAAEGSIRDLSSSARIQLILDTNVKKARSLAQLEASEDPAYLLSAPAWRLARTGARKKPRGDWKLRWKAAGDSVGWRGALRREFVALKDSPIWEALGKGAGGFADALGSPYPPYAFGSGLGWVDVPLSEWRRLCGRYGVEAEMPSAAGVRREGASGGDAARGAASGGIAELEAALREWEAADEREIERERKEEDESGRLAPLSLPGYAKKGFWQRKAEEAVARAGKSLEKHLGYVKNLISRDVKSCGRVLGAAGGQKDLERRWKVLDAQVAAAAKAYGDALAENAADGKLLSGVKTPSESAEERCEAVYSSALERGRAAYARYREALVVRSELKGLEQEAKKRQVVAVASSKGVGRRELEQSVRRLFGGYRRQGLNRARVRPANVGAAVRAVSSANDGFGRIISAKDDIMEAVEKSARPENVKEEIREAVKSHSMSAMRKFLVERSRGSFRRVETVSDAIPSAQKKAVAGKIADAADFVSSVAAKRCVDGKRVDVAVMPSRRSSGDRAKYVPQANMIIASSDDKKKTYVHELGHWLSEKNPHVAELCQAFLEHRIGREAPERLSALTGNGKYKDDEVACKDHFLNPYMGRIYQKADGRPPLNEILSMGLQMIYEDLTTPVERLNRKPLYLADREYFDFVVSVIKEEI